VILQQVLKQTRGYGCTQVGIGVNTPLPGEEPDFLRMLFDVILNTQDRLPSWV